MIDDELNGPSGRMMDLPFSEAEMLCLLKMDFNEILCYFHRKLVSNVVHFPSAFNPLSW